MIENTSKSIQDPANRMAFLAASMGPGGADQAVAEQERAGQAQLVVSDQLPADLNGDGQADFEALGFVFGDLTPGDPLFRAVTLPEGWRKEPSEHDMWSHIVDQLGRCRVSVFYKAVFYDRRAHMNVMTVAGYVDRCVQQGTGVQADDTWATPAAVTEAAREGADRYGRWEQRALDNKERDATDLTAKRKGYEALIARFEAVTEA